MAGATTYDVGRHRVRVSHPDKMLYPAKELTKSHVIDYYRTVADVMLPQLRGRPLTLRRFPDGVERDGFFQKEVSAHFPDWIPTVDVPQRSAAEPVRQVVCEDVATLVYLADQACLELHPWLSRTDALDRPDRMVVDLDPSDGIDVADLRAVARKVRDRLADAGLVPYVQTTGSRGFHVVAPLDRSADFDEVRNGARALADELAAADPELLTTEVRKERRGRRIFLDTARNAYGQTAIAPYSLRARPEASVATPIRWSELGRVRPAEYDPDKIARRLARTDDPWSSLDKHGRSARILAAS